MKDFELKAADVAQYARGHWDQIYASLAPELEEAIAKKGRHVACPVHGGTDGFRLHKNWDEGQGICNTCSEFVRGGERTWQKGFGVLMWITGRKFPEVLHDVAEIVAPQLLNDAGAARKSRPARVPVYVPPKRTQKDIDEDLSMVERMRRTWKESVPMTDTAAKVAWRYLESRGLPDPRGAEGIWDSLRFHPSLYYRGAEGENKFPAIVCLLRNKDGKVRGVHRIYLARDGWGKAPVEDAKKLMGKPDSVSLHDCAIRMGAPAKVIALAEGVETAMAVRAFTGFTVWSAVNATLLRQFRPPEGVLGVHIFGDLDRSEEGQNAMRDLAENLKGLGYHVRADVPPGPIPVGMKGVDWLDVYNQRGTQAIQQVESLRPMLAQRTVIPFPNAARRAG